MSQNKPKVNIFVSHRIDLDSVVVDNHVYRPVRCGACFEPDYTGPMLGDHTGENISEMRMKVGEFTVQYWAWKNMDADYYGICHYRRYLSFADKKYDTDEKNQVIERDLCERTIKKYRLDDPDYIRDTIAKYDAVVGEYADISGMYTPRGPRPTLKEHFEAYDRHLINKEDLKLFLDTLDKLYPKVGKCAREYFAGNKFRGYNCFVLKKDLFFEMCQMEVDVLEAVKNSGQISFEHRTALQGRTYGFMVEWMYGVYLYYLEKQKNVKIKTTQLVFFENTEAFKYPAPKKDAIPVAFLTNRYLLPSAHVLIQSIADHAAAEDTYDIIVMHEELTKEDQQELQDAFASDSRLSIRFLDFKNALPAASNGFYWTRKDNPTLSALFLPWLLPEYKRVVYLHTDVLLRSDLRQLHDASFDGSWIMAPRDHLRICENNYDRDVEKLRKHKLGMEDPYDFFSTSIMVMDLEALRSNTTYDQVMRFTTTNFTCRDAANQLYTGNVKFLDPAWNVCPFAGPHMKLLAEYMPKKFSDADKNAAKAPKAIHHQAFPKPWHSPFVANASIFWSVARRTVVYEQLLTEVAAATAGGGDPASAPREGLAIRMANKLLPLGSRRRQLAKKIVPKGSARWNFLKKVYHIFKK